MWIFKMRRATSSVWEEARERWNTECRDSPGNASTLWREGGLMRDVAAAELLASCDLYLGTSSSSSSPPSYPLLNPLCLKHTCYLLSSSHHYDQTSLCTLAHTWSFYYSVSRERVHLKLHGYVLWQKKKSCLFLTLLYENLAFLQHGLQDRQTHNIEGCMSVCAMTEMKRSGLSLRSWVSVSKTESWRKASTLQCNTYATIQYSPI